MEDKDRPPIKDSYFRMLIPSADKVDLFTLARNCEMSASELVLTLIREEKARCLAGQRR